MCITIVHSLSILHNILLSACTVIYPFPPSKRAELVSRVCIRNNDVENVFALGFWRTSVRVSQGDDLQVELSRLC